MHAVFKTDCTWQCSLFWLHFITRVEVICLRKNYNQINNNVSKDELSSRFYANIDEIWGFMPTLMKYEHILGILISISDMRYTCTVPLLLQLLLMHGNAGFGFILTHPSHARLVCHSPGCTVHTGFVGHFAVRLHSWLLFSLLSTKTTRASSTELLPSCSVFPLSGHLSDMVLSSHVLRVGRLLPLPQHSTTQSQRDCRSLWNQDLGN